MTTYGKPRLKPSEIGAGYRRSVEEIAILDRALIAIVGEQRPLTVRSAYYVASSRGEVPKNEDYGYRTVQRRLTHLREGTSPNGRVRMIDIVDPTRPLERYPSFASPKTGLDELAAGYRKDLWDQVEFDVYLVSEKSTVMGTLQPVLETLLVPFMTIHGYNSISASWRLARRIEARNKDAWVLGIGDRDPDGRAIRRDVAAKIDQYAPDAEVTFIDLALTIGQIADNGIEYRKTKKTQAYMGPIGHDPGFGKVGDFTSAELDALPPNVLRDLVEAEIVRDIEDTIAEVKAAEKADIGRLTNFAGKFKG